MPERLISIVDISLAPTPLAINIIEADYSLMIKNDLRNAIVHDYLNLDWEAIQVVIGQKKYVVTAEFVVQGCACLRA